MTHQERDQANDRQRDLDPWARRAVRVIERRVTSPLMRSALRLGIAPRVFALLETTGRRSGRPRWTPVGNGLVGRVFWLVAERGERCDYVRNILADPRVRVKVGRHWHNGTAQIVADDDGLARRRGIDAVHGLAGRMDGALFRMHAEGVLTIRIDLDPD